jgi:uncharacterized membrane protein YgcG
MATSAEDFERAWGSHVRGGAEPPSADLRELVAVAEGLRSFQTAVQAPAAESAWDRLSEAIGGEAGVSSGVVVALRPRKPRRRMMLRVAIAAVAVFTALATASLRATPGSFLYPLRTGLEKTALLLAPGDGSLHLHVAQARLDDLVLALRDGPQSEAPGLAEALMDQRSEALAHGASVTTLDADIHSEVPPALTSAPPDIAQQVRAILGLPPHSDVDVRAAPPGGVSEHPQGSTVDPSPADVAPTGTSDSSGNVSSGSSGQSESSGSNGGGTSQPNSGGDSSGSQGGDQSGNDGGSGGNSDGGSNSGDGSSGSGNVQGASGSTDGGSGGNSSN